MNAIAEFYCSDGQLYNPFSNGSFGISPNSVGTVTVGSVLFYLMTVWVSRKAGDMWR